jgi:hypothetical protein
MAEPSNPPQVKLICGMISARGELFAQTVSALVGQFGPVDITSEVVDFDFTSYYDQEMGHPLYRQFVAFDQLVCPDILAPAKLTTNAIEARFRQTCPPGLPPRPVNLDVGYIESGKLVLASMKNFSHRIYLGRSVFAEVTLMYHRAGWDALPWTFPDYASGRYSPFLNSARAKMREQIEQESRP